jgi:phospholipid/cholesterol/gamma-HCH transport system substrate-binding protein
MASHKLKFSVGLFVATGIGFALLAIIWLGMSRFFEKGQYFVTYFNESVQGLDMESPVKYRGVSIGRVQTIGVAPDSKLIEVVLKIDAGKSLGSDIVAQLKSVGITGSMFVELDRKRPNEPDHAPPLSFPTEYPVVASKPSEISELVRGIDDMLDQIRSLDLKGISEKVKLSFDKINHKLDHADIKGVSENLTASLVSMRDLLSDDRWDRIVGSVAEAGENLNDLVLRANKGLGTIESIVGDNESVINLAIRDFGQAMASANILLEKSQALINGTDASQTQLRRHLVVVAQNLEKASEDLQRLLDVLSKHPSQLMFGEPPRARMVEPETK